MAFFLISIVFAHFFSLIHLVASTNLFVRFSFHRPKMVVEGYAAPSEGEVCLLFSSFFIYPCGSFVLQL